MPKALFQKNGQLLSYSEHPLIDSEEESIKVRSGSLNRCNNLSGKEWLQNSLSIWSNIQKNQDEYTNGHPATFPQALVRRLLDCFTNDTDKVVLDPFMGTGTTIIEAVNKGKKGIGFDVYSNYITLVEKRLAQGNLLYNRGDVKLINDTSSNILNHLPENSVDIVITSPPYWDILTQRRTADGKDTRKYGDDARDIGLIHEYDKFMTNLCKIFADISKILRKDKYCIINVMDIRKGAKYFPVHSDLSTMLSGYGFELDDIVIWNRAHEYNNLRPLGFPSVFRINRIHEYIVIFKNRK